MKRILEEKLKNWYLQKTRKVLVLRGARQVGKSTLVRQFAEAQHLELLEINLEKTPLQSIKQEGIRLSEIIQEIEILFSKRITQQTLLFLDEIQAQPKLLQALIYFYEEKPELPVIAAGSLLDFALENEKLSVPVGRIEYLTLGPMTYFEFLQAMDEPVLCDLFKSVDLRKEINLPEAAHKKFIDLFKQYLFVGGMPEAVQVYKTARSPLEVRRIQAALLQTYQDDFSKYVRFAHMDRVRAVFQYVPGALGQKVKYVSIDRDQKSRDMKSAVSLLIKAKVIIPVFHTNASGLPLRAQRDDSVYKLYFLDVGLASAALGLDWASLHYQEEALTKGAVVEQFVAQHLFYSDGNFIEPELFYWLRDKKSSNAEVDFVITIDGKIVPIEVKSGRSNSTKSLSVFLNEKKVPLAIKMNLKMPSKKKVESGSTTFDLQTLPLYLAEKIF